MTTTKILLYTLITFIVLGVLGAAAYLIYSQSQTTQIINGSNQNPTSLASTTINYNNTNSSLPTFNINTSSSLPAITISSSIVTNTSSSTSPTENKDTNESTSSKAPVVPAKGYLNNNFSNLALDLPTGWSVVENVVSVGNIGGIDRPANGLIIKSENGENRLNFTYGIYNGELGPNKSKNNNMWLQPSEFVVLKNDWVRVKYFDKDSNLETFVYIPPQNIILKENKAFSNEVAKCDSIKNGRVEGDMEQCVNYKSAGALVNKDSFTYIKAKIKSPLLIDPNKQLLESSDLKRFFESEGLGFVATLSFQGKIVDDADRIVESMTIDLNQ